MNTIYLITISSNVYIPYFRRNGPITSIERVNKTLLDSFKNMGYDVTVVGTEGGTLNTPVVNPITITEIIPATLADISEKLSVPLVEETSIETEEEDEVDETVEESEEDTDTEEEAEEESDESTDLVLPSKAELNKMNVATLINTLTVFIDSIDDQYLPLEGKTKKQLLDIASTITA